MRRFAAVAAVLALLAAAAWAADGVRAGLGPTIERAVKGERCVEPSDDMRRNHMRYLEHQRDATVHGGIRGAKHSLKGCVDCHAGRISGSVAKSEGDFCVSCHRYAAVKVDCFECHATRPGATPVAAKGSGG